METTRSDYKKFTIVCHDAGATNLILHLLRDSIRLI